MQRIRRPPGSANALRSIAIRLVLSCATLASALTAEPGLCQTTGQAPSSAEAEDPRDAKLRELEARLEATEQQLADQNRRIRLESSHRGDDEEDSLFPLELTA